MKELNSDSLFCIPDMPGPLWPPPMYLATLPIRLFVGIPVAQNRGYYWASFKDPPTELLLHLIFRHCAPARHQDLLEGTESTKDGPETEYQETTHGQIATLSPVFIKHGGGGGARGVNFNIKEKICELNLKSISGYFNKMSVLRLWGSL